MISRVPCQFKLFHYCNPQAHAEEHKVFHVHRSTSTTHCNIWQIHYVRATRPEGSGEKLKSHNIVFAFLERDLFIFMMQVDI